MRRRLLLLLLLTTVVVDVATSLAASRANTNKKDPMRVSNKSRRDCLHSCFVAGASTTAAIGCTANFLPPAAAFALTPQTSDNDDEMLQIERQCRNGALAVEQAIPGAYQQVCMTLPNRKISIQTASSPTAPAVELNISQQAVGSGSTGTVVWNSSLLMTRLLERLAALDTTILKNKAVLELGCGTGLVSLTAACLGAQNVIATDGNPAVVELAARNVATNHLEQTVETASLQWGLFGAMDYAEKADVVVGSDLTYFSGSWPVLAETMATVLKPGGAVLYLSLGHSGFNVNAEVDGFLSVAAGYGLKPMMLQSGSIGWTDKQLTALLLNECLTPEDRAIVQSSGGVRVVTLQRKLR